MLLGNCIGLLGSSREEGTIVCRGYIGINFSFSLPTLSKQR